MSGVLNFIYWVSVAAAPAEPGEGGGDAASPLPPCTPTRPRGEGRRRTGPSAGSLVPFRWQRRGVFPYGEQQLLVTVASLSGSAAVSRGETQAL